MSFFHMSNNQLKKIVQKFNKPGMNWSNGDKIKTKWCSRFHSCW